MTDLDLALDQARSGGEEGFMVLWRAFQPRLLRFLQVYVGREVDDLASETWLNVVRGLPAFRGDSASFASWLFTIARRRALDTLRSSKRRPVLAHEDLPELPGPDAESLVLEAISTSEALALVRRLPPALAEAVVLRVVVGLDNESIAGILGISEGAVRVRVHRGLKRLHQTWPSPSEEEVGA